MTDERITISRAQFQEVAMKAFADAGRQAIERMIELAETPEAEAIVRDLGGKCLAEIGETL